MNENQRKTLKAVIVAVILTILFPPYQDGGTNHGYNFILDPPHSGSINIAVLLVQWIGIGIIGGLFFFLFRVGAEPAVTTPGSPAIQVQLLLPKFQTHQKKNWLGKEGGCFSLLSPWGS